MRDCSVLRPCIVRIRTANLFANYTCFSLIRVRHVPSVFDARHRLPHRWKRSHIDVRSRRYSRCPVCGALFAINRSLYRRISDLAGSSSGRSCSDRPFRDRAQYESYVPGSYRGRPSTYTPRWIREKCPLTDRYTGLAPL